MIFYLYDDFEAEYHCLECAHCTCSPRIITIEGTAAVLLIHHRLAEPDRIWEREEIEGAIQDIKDQFL